MKTMDQGGDGPLSEAEQQQFFQSIEGVARASVAQLRAAPSGETVVHWVGGLHHNMDGVIQRHGQAGTPVACQKACAHCCHVRVEALPAEIFRIAHHLRTHAGGALGEVTQRLRTHARLLNPTTQAPGQRPACAFLSNEQLCTVYEVRPSVCRKGHSLDVTACQTHAPTIPQRLALLVDAEALIQGASQAYGQLGVQSGGFELVAGVLLALVDPTAQDRWLAGERVFSEG